MFTTDLILLVNLKNPIIKHHRDILREQGGN